MNPIPTRYKGYHFRSRLEARWAVCLDALGLKWQYEPEGFVDENGVCYLPDFYIESIGMWAEVKPTWPTEEEIAKAYSLCLATGKEVLFLDGTPRDTNYWAIAKHAWHSESTTPEGHPEWNDYLLTRCKATKTDSRLYACWGGCYERKGSNRPDQELMIDSSVTEAIEAARSARFEFGESGRT